MIWFVYLDDYLANSCLSQIYFWEKFERANMLTYRELRKEPIRVRTTMKESEKHCRAQEYQMKSNGFWKEWKRIVSMYRKTEIAFPVTCTQFKSIE